MTPEERELEQRSLHENMQATQKAALEAQAAFTNHVALFGSLLPNI